MTSCGKLRVTLDVPEVGEVSVVESQQAEISGERDRHIAAEDALDADPSPTAFPANGLEAVRACLSTSRLTREEREALLDPAYGRDQEERTSAS
jgi:hypothetical protein